MGRQTQWVNNDGLEIGFGKMDTDNIEGASRRTVGLRNELTIDLHWDDLNYPAGVVPTSRHMPLPKGSKVINATLIVEEAFVGGTSIAIGTKFKDGTLMTADDIFDAILLAEIDAIDKVVLGDGDNITGLVAFEDNAYISITPVGTFTAGKASVTIEYNAPDA